MRKAFWTVLALLASACSLAPASSVEPTAVETSTASAAVPTASLVATETPTLAPSAPPLTATPSADNFQFIRWIGGYKILAIDEPGGPVYGSQDVHIEMDAGVVDKVDIDGIEWIRVQFGSDRPGDWTTYGWAPAEADIDRAGGIHVDPVYEYVEPECPDKATPAHIGGLVPMQSLTCFGSQSLSFSPVIVRNEGNELDYHVDGNPEWLAIGDGLMAHWLPGYEELGAFAVYVDPASNVDIPKDQWVEITGQLDHPAARDCDMTSSEREILDVRNEAEAVLLCRGHFVVTGVRELTDAEIPDSPQHVTPGPPPAETIATTLTEFDGPFGTRLGLSSVWTGEEMLVWGGSTWHDDRNPTPNADGAAYDPDTDSWRTIPEAPIRPREGQTTAWTGEEMLIWGGWTQKLLPASGAAYNPATNEWREIPGGPLRPSYQVSSVWTGDEWWVASARMDRVEVAAYDPQSNSWRSLPTLMIGNGDRTDIVWAGGEILVLSNSGATNAGGLHRISVGESEWRFVPVDFYGRLTSTGELVVGARTDNIASDPLDWEPFTYPVFWNPRTNEEVEMPMPPHSVLSDPVWTGRDLIFVESRLAFDLDAREWRTLTVPEPIDVPIERDEPAMAWADDRLVVWGGWSGCPGYSDRYDRGFELVLDLTQVAGFAATALPNYQAALSTPRMRAGPPIEGSNAWLFAC